MKSLRVAGLGRKPTNISAAAQRGKGVDVPAPTHSYRATFDDASDLSQTPEYVLRYIAPMACGVRERAELVRRRLIAEKLNPPCPKCGGETAVQRWLAHECSVGCDTSQRHCVECDWLGDPE